MKVKVVNAESNLYGSLLSEYQKMGYLYVADIFDNDNVAISYSPVGGMLVNLDKSVLEPFYDENILHVYDNKKRELKRINKEISDIEKYINDKCKTN